jgi:hypothetical protein
MYSISTQEIKGDYVELLTAMLIFPTGLTALTASSIPLNLGFAIRAPSFARLRAFAYPLT